MSFHTCDICRPVTWRKLANLRTQPAYFPNPVPSKLTAWDHWHHVRLRNFTHEWFKPVKELQIYAPKLHTCILVKLELVSKLKMPWHQESSRKFGTLQCETLNHRPRLVEKGHAKYMEVLWRYFHQESGRRRHLGAPLRCVRWRSTKFVMMIAHHCCLHVYLQRVQYSSCIPWAYRIGGALFSFPFSLMLPSSTSRSEVWDWPVHLEFNCPQSAKSDSSQ